MINERLRALRCSRGWTQQDVAERLCLLVEQHTGSNPGVDANYVSRLERGIFTWPDRAYRAAFRSLFGVADASLGFYNKRLGTIARGSDTELLDATVSPALAAGSATSDDHAERALVALERDRLDGPVLEYLTRTLAEHRRIEDRLGARVMLPVVSAQYAMITRMVRHTPGSLHDEALSLAAQYAQFRAWMQHDQRDNDSALRSFADAESQAQESGDATMAACVLSMKAHLAWGIGQPLASMRYAQAAQWSAHLITPAARGMAAQMEARALAVLGRKQEADRKIDEATGLLAHAAEHREDEPAWLYFYEGTWLMLQIGAAQADLGRSRRAIDQLSQALGQLDPIYVRDAAWYHAILARTYLDAGDLEQAAATALATLPDARATNAYALDHLTVTATKLRERAPSMDTVRLLHEASATARPPHALITSR